MNNSVEYPNIAAFVIDEETKESIADIFSALTVTWNYAPKECEIDLYKNFYERRYQADKCLLFEQAINLNLRSLGKKDLHLDTYLNLLGTSL